MFVLTGATGHIGGAVMRELHARGLAVRAVVLPFEREFVLPIMPDERAEGDVTRPEDCLDFVHEGDVVLHLAGVISIASGAEAAMERVNVRGTANVVDACLKNKAARLVYVSSVHAFPEAASVDETTPIAEDTAYGAYGRSKAAATLVVRRGMEAGLDAVIVHPSGVIGPYDQQLTNNMTQTLILLATGRLPALVGGGYDFVDVRDVAFGIVEAALTGCRGAHYILSGQWAPVAQLAACLRPLVTVRMPRVTLPLWLVAWVAPLAQRWAHWRRQRPIVTPYSIHTLGAAPRFCHDRATRELGYRPRSLSDTLRDTLTWLREQRLLTRG